MIDPSVSGPRPNRARWIAFGVAILVVALVLVLGSRPAAKSTGVATPLGGKEAPTFMGTTLDGGAFDLATLRGRYVVVNFFATWCTPCREEHPELRKFAERHGRADGPRIVAVAYDENDIGATRAFFAREGGGWPVVISNGDRIAVDYGVRGLPETFMVNPNGKVVAHTRGQVTADQLDKFMSTAS